MIKVFKPIFIFLGTLFMVSSVQWLLMLIYHNYCLDTSVYGIITNMVSMGGPVCQSLNKIQ